MEDNNIKINIPNFKNIKQSLLHIKVTVPAKTIYVKCDVYG